MEDIRAFYTKVTKNKLKISGWVLTFLWLPFLWSCEKEEIGCLPYEGEIFPVSYKGMFGMSCNGVVIKVTNTSVDSFLERDRELGREENVITARIPDGIGFEEYFGFPIDETSEGKKFYFDFRELRKEEYNVCTMESTEPTRLVYMTRFSLRRCEITDE